MDSAKLEQTYLRAADLRMANLKNSNLEKADLRRCNLDSCNLIGANLKSADLKGANLTDAIIYDARLKDAQLTEANLEHIKTDTGTSWYGVRGLHKATRYPDDLKGNTDLENAIEISRALDDIEQGMIEQAVSAINDVQTRINSSDVSASVWNKLAWLSSICGYKVDYNKQEIVDVSCKAIDKNDRANYRDTYGVALAINGNYQEAIQQFEKVLESDDFKNFDQTIIQRREKWIQSLKNNENPFTEEELKFLRENE